MATATPLDKINEAIDIWRLCYNGVSGRVTTDFTDLRFDDLKEQGEATVSANRLNAFVAYYSVMAGVPKKTWQEVAHSYRFYQNGLRPINTRYWTSENLALLRDKDPADRAVFWFKRAYDHDLIKITDRFALLSLLVEMQQTAGAAVAAGAAESSESDSVDDLGFQGNDGEDVASADSEEDVAIREQAEEQLNELSTKIDNAYKIRFAARQMHESLSKEDEQELLQYKKKLDESQKNYNTLKRQHAQLTHKRNTDKSKYRTFKAKVASALTAATEAFSKDSSDDDTPGIAKSSGATGDGATGGGATGGGATGSDATGSGIAVGSAAAQVADSLLFRRMSNLRF